MARKPSDIDRQLISEWLKRPDDTRTENDVLIFYGEIAKSKPHLLGFKYPGDKYQALKSILRNHIREQAH
jgi:hypothetical protein